MNRRWEGRAASAVGLPTAVLTLAAVLALAACGGPSSKAAAPSEPTGSVAPTTVALPPKARLASFAARGQDHYFTATYRFAPAGGAAETTLNVIRTPSGLRVDLAQPADAASVARTVTAVRTPTGAYVCVVTAAAKGCVNARTPGAAAVEPRVWHVFGNWLAVLADPGAAISVTVVPTPAGATGTCFSVEGVAASLDAPVDSGRYCFDDAGMVTALRIGAGDATLAQSGPPPAEMNLPAPLGPALPATAAPPTSPPPPSSPAASR
ncbi:MAG TPA: hypothetical protein VGR21_08360 [Cryptosporangiaceae bacterium]|nr:hypothetical protein [Cryptosporangiaceae bacterium]